MPVGSVAHALKIINLADWRHGNPPKTYLDIRVMYC
jgi:hypothetical protein